MKFYAPFCLPFLVGALVMAAVIAWKYVVWFAELPRADKKRVLFGIPTPRTLGAVGEVIGLSGKRATVGFGQILTTIDLNRLEPISNAEYKKATRELRPAAPPTNFSTAERRLQFHEQIDVRGMRVAEAVETVQDFVDEAIMLGFSEIRILHGKGTGALKEEIRSYLRTVPLVRSAKDEHEEMGGAGITVVKLDI